jgi:hypothetical protein
MSKFMDKLEMALDLHGLHKTFDDFYNAYCPDITNDEKNVFRHITGSALYAQKHNSDAVRDMGYLKERADRVRAKFDSLVQNSQQPIIDNYNDSKIDIANNEKGIAIGEQFPDMNRNSIMQYVLKKHIEPKRKNLYR